MSRPAIIVTFVGPSNTRPARVRARCPAGSLTMSFDHQFSWEDNAHVTVAKLVDKVGWNAWAWTMTNWAVGSLPNGDLVFVWKEA